MAETSQATQEFVPIKEIRDGVVVLKNGGLRLVLIVSSLNFALKSEDEKEAIILQYQNFLNSLDFHVQLFIQSRRLDIKPYLATLETRQKEQTNELIKVQTREYIEFIRNFTNSTDVMAKTFFVCVPYDAAMVNLKKGGILSGLWPGKNPNKSAADLATEKFEERRSQIEQRAAVVIQGLSRFGVRAIPLGTEELVELFFKIFNPGEAEIPTAA